MTDPISGLTDCIYLLTKRKNLYSTNNSDVVWIQDMIHRLEEIRYGLQSGTTSECRPWGGMTNPFEDLFQEGYIEKVDGKDWLFRTTEKGAHLFDNFLPAKKISLWEKLKKFCTHAVQG